MLSEIKEVIRSVLIGLLIAQGICLGVAAILGVTLFPVYLISVFGIGSVAYKTIIIISYNIIFAVIAFVAIKKLS